MTLKKATDRGLGIPKEPVLMKASYGRSKYVTTIIFRADEPGRIKEEIKSKTDR